ncbi:hypothetical protein TNCV_2967131 [Trichonephila clavipes]|nr:hypothetical protein TNCV_2967131 [Trichonephila clavipes]
MDLVTLNPRQVTRATPEMATPSPNFYSAPTGRRSSLDRFNEHRPLYMSGHQNRQRRLKARANWTRAQGLGYDGGLILFSVQP